MARRKKRRTCNKRKISRVSSVSSVMKKEISRVIALKRNPTVDEQGKDKDSSGSKIYVLGECERKWIDDTEKTRWYLGGTDATPARGR